MLYRVSCHDPVFQRYLKSTGSYNAGVDNDVCRTKTADFDAAAQSFNQQRPSTSSTPSSSKVSEMKISRTVLTEKESDLSLGHVTGSEVHLVLSSNWGDPFYIGLTGIALLETGSEEPVLLRPDQVDLLLAPSKEDDENFVHRQSSELGAIVDGVNVTTDVANMWACPVASTMGGVHSPTLVVKLDRLTSLRGLRVWNYNASLEDSYKGVRNFIDSLQ